VQRIRTFDALRWGGVSHLDLVDVVYRALGLPHEPRFESRWRQRLLVLLGGLRTRGMQLSFSLLADLIESAQLRNDEARFFTDHHARAVWRSLTFDKPAETHAVATRLRALDARTGGGAFFHGMPNTRRSDFFEFDFRAGPAEGRTVMMALFVTCYHAAFRADAPALLTRLPGLHPEHDYDAWRSVLDRFDGPVALATPPFRALSEQTRVWLARRIEAHGSDATTVTSNAAAARPLRESRASNAARNAAVPWYGDATSERRLYEAWSVVQRGGSAAGVDRMTVAQFGRELYGQIFYLAEDLRGGRYVPLPLRRVAVPKANGDSRMLHIPTVRDRVVHAAAMLTLQPYFDRRFLDSSFGFRPGRSAHQAIRAVEHYRDDGFTWAVTADIRKCFDTINLDVLFKRLQGSLKSEALLALLRALMTVPSTDGTETFPHTGVGVPQGGPVSPLLANVYLHPLDVHMGGRAWVRYADDFICLARSRSDAEQVLETIRTFVESELQQELKPAATDLCAVSEGFDFLGFNIRSEGKRIIPTRLERFRARLQAIAMNADHPVETRLQKLSEVMQGFAAYFSVDEPLVTHQLAAVERWVRFVLTRDVGVKERDFILPSFFTTTPGARRPPERDFYADLDRLEVPRPEKTTRQEQVHSVTRIVAAPAGDDTLLVRSEPPSDAPPPVEHPAWDPVEAPEDPDPSPAPADTNISPGPQRADTGDVIPDAAARAPIPSVDGGPAALAMTDGYTTEEVREFLHSASLASESVVAREGVAIVTLHGAVLSCESRHVVVRKKGAVISRLALAELRQIVVQAVGVIVTSSLLRELAPRAIMLHLLDWKGRPYGVFSAPGRESPAALRGQLRAADTHRGVEIGRSMLVAKGQNQLRVLRLYGRYREKVRPAAGKAIAHACRVMRENLTALRAVDAETLTLVRGRFLAVEGRIAAAYFRGIAAVLPETRFRTRLRQQLGRDIVNTLLDYTYALLYTTCHRALVLAGVDPRIGFVHTDGAQGKLSMVYDFVEEFRAVGADRVILSMLTRGITIRRTKADILTLPSRRKIVGAFTRNLEGRLRYRTERCKLGDIIDAQARHLATALAKPRVIYKPFLYNH